MPTELFANNVSTTLTAPMLAGDLTATVAAAAPAALQGGQFRIVVNAEIMIVTAGAATTTWTVTRGAEGTIAVAHDAASVVRHVLTAGSLTAPFAALEARFAAIEAASSATDALLLAHVTDGGGSLPITGPASYIAPTGSDTTGTGSEAAPWATIQKWVDSAPVAGATLYVRGGTYTAMSLAYVGYDGHPSLTGTVTEPITIRNYAGEVPTFAGGSSALIGLAACSYVVVDGLKMTGRDIGQSGYIFTGAYGQAGYPAHHITLRNLTVDFSLAGQATTEHGIYPAEGSEYIAIEDCLIKGPGAGNGGGYGLHVYTSASNAPRNLTVQRCIFDGWDQAGLLLWHTGITATIDHCTFIRNVVDARLEYHAAVTLRNSAFDTAAGVTAIKDPYNASQTTTGYNFFSQSFDASYLLLAGQTGRSAASDGTDAGALDW